MENETVITLQQAMPYIRIIIGIISIALGVFSFTKKNRIFFYIEIGILLVLAFVVYDPKAGNFTNVLTLGIISLLSYAMGFGIVYIIKRRKGKLKDDETIRKDKF